MSLPRSKKKSWFILVFQHKIIMLNAITRSEAERRARGEFRISSAPNIETANQMHVTLFELVTGRKLKDGDFIDMSEPENSTAFELGIKHKGSAPGGIRGHKFYGNNPLAYLGKFLKMFRPFAKATQDDSWGELEKLLEIVHRKISVQRYEQALDRIDKAQFDLDESKEALAKAKEYCDNNLHEGWGASISRNRRIIRES